MDPVYSDRWIQCAADGMSIRGYYFPWGTKHVPYKSIRSLRRFEMSALKGKPRIWGTANPRYWASFDPSRPKKEVGFILDLGRRVMPFITPDDPDAFESAIRQCTGLEPSEQPGTGSPFV